MATDEVRADGSPYVATDGNLSVSEKIERKEGKKISAQS
jgi:hypothetical protein